MNIELSVPFSSGQWLLPTLPMAGLRSYRLLLFQSPFHRGNGCYPTPQCQTCALFDFQSPFHRGNGCYFNHSEPALFSTPTFSPLFIGAMVATQ